MLWKDYQFMPLWSVMRKIGFRAARPTRIVVFEVVKEFLARKWDPRKEEEVKQRHLNTQWRWSFFSRRSHVLLNIISYSEDQLIFKEDNSAEYDTTSVSGSKMCWRGWVISSPELSWTDPRTVLRDVSFHERCCQKRLLSRPWIYRLQV